jgi:hypothetical protein
MSITYKWSIQKLRTDNTLSAVAQADWFCAAVNENEVIQAAASGTKEFSLSSGFTPFDELTEDQVLGWCFEPETITHTDKDNNVTTIVKHLKADTEAQVAGQIQHELERIQTEPALPWV